MARTPVRLWVAAGLALAVLLAFGGWALVVSPQRANAAEDRTSLAEMQAQNAALRARSDVLAVQLEDIDGRRADLTEKRAALPDTNDLEGLVVALNAAAASAGVLVEEVVSSGPMDITPVPAVAPVTATEGAEDAGITPETGAAVDVAPAAADALYALPVTVRVSGQLPAVEEFLRIVQSQPRAILFASLAMVPSEGGEILDQGVTMTAETRVFAAPEEVATTTSTEPVPAASPAG